MWDRTVVVVLGNNSSLPGPEEVVNATVNVTNLTTTAPDTTTTSFPWLPLVFLLVLAAAVTFLYLRRKGRRRWR